MGIPIKFKRHSLQACYPDETANPWAKLGLVVVSPR